MTQREFFVAKNHIHIGTNIIFKGTMFWCEKMELPVPDGKGFSRDDYYEQLDFFVTDGKPETYERP